MKLTSPFQRQIDQTIPRDEKDAKLLGWLRECGNASEVEKRYGISRHKVRALYRRYDLRARRGRYRMEEEDTRMVEMWREGMSFQQIADEMGTTKQNIQQHVARRVQGYDQTDNRERLARGRKTREGRSKEKRLAWLRAEEPELRRLFELHSSVAEVSKASGKSVPAIYAHVSAMKKELGVDVRNPSGSSEAPPGPSSLP